MRGAVSRAVVEHREGGIKEVNANILYYIVFSIFLFLLPPIFLLSIFTTGWWTIPLGARRRC
jgi:hypothetical protein